MPPPLFYYITGENENKFIKKWTKCNFCSYNRFGLKLGSIKSYMKKDDK